MHIFTYIIHNKLGQIIYYPLLKNETSEVEDSHQFVFLRRGMAMIIIIENNCNYNNFFSSYTALGGIGVSRLFGLPPFEKKQQQTDITTQ